MDFTIDDMIEFCKSERDYHSKKSDKRKEIYFPNETPEIHSYMLGNHIGFKIAYGNMAESLIKLKENQNETGEIYEEEILDKIVAIVQTAEEEIGFCDKLNAAVVKRVTYNKIVKLLKENNYIQDVR